MLWSVYRGADSQYRDPWTELRQKVAEGFDGGCSIRSAGVVSGDLELLVEFEHSAGGHDVFIGREFAQSEPGPVEYRLIREFQGEVELDGKVERDVEELRAKQ